MTADELETRFRANMKAMRKELGISQSEIARRMGTTPGYICDLERGTRSPNLRTLAPLAEAIGVAPDSLLSQPRAENSEIPA